jgi:hypothetical protein
MPQPLRRLPVAASWSRRPPFSALLLLKKSTVLIHFFTNCDRSAEILSRLIQTLKEITERIQPSRAVKLNLNPIGYNAVPDASAAVEIAVSFVQNCFGAGDPSVKTLIAVV